MSLGMNLIVAIGFYMDYKRSHPIIVRKPVYKNRDLPTCVYRTPNGRYKSKIKHKGKAQHLGVFDTPKEASDAYQQALKKVNRII